LNGAASSRGSDSSAVAGSGERILAHSGAAVVLRRGELVVGVVFEFEGIGLRLHARLTAPRWR
jgi:preprotein translocase subunit SecG